MKHLFILFFLITSISAAGHDMMKDGIYYITLSDNTAAVTFKGKTCQEYAGEYSGDIVIPETVYSYTVVAIADQAFYDCPQLISVEIPSTVTKIGKDAFHADKYLRSVIIPNEVTSIGEYAFADCTFLQTISIPNNIKRINEATFANCKNLKKIEIPSSVSFIGKLAFCDCTKLTEISIPNSVSTIRDYAFSGCTQLSIITFGTGTKSIGNYAFSDCPNLGSIILHPIQPPSLDETSFSPINYKQTTLTIPENSLPQYKEHSIWSKFRLMQCSGISTLVCDSDSISIVGHKIIAPAGSITYSLNGSIIRDADDLDNGVYVVRIPSGKVYKVFIH